MQQGIIWKFRDGGDNISAISKVPTLNMKRPGDRLQKNRIRFYQLCIFFLFKKRLLLSIKESLLNWPVVKRKHIYYKAIQFG